MSVQLKLKKKTAERKPLEPQVESELTVVIHKFVWKVGKSRDFVDSISAVWMFARLLQVNNCADACSLELFDHFEFFDQTRAGPLTCNDIVRCPGAMQSVYGMTARIVLLSLEVFPFAGNSFAKVFAVYLGPHVFVECISH